MFKCKQCGCCCKAFNDIDTQVEFPFQRTSGTCEKLVDNKCSIYNDRPDCCRYDKWNHDNDAKKQKLQEDACEMIRSLIYDIH